MNHAKKLSAEERDWIAVWRGQGVGVREMARRLGRNSGTVSRELARNGHAEAGYVAIHAQRLTEERKTVARARHPLKDPGTYAYVHDKLRSGWSPELIAGRLREERGQSVLHHETIYRFLYAPENAAKRLWEYLPWKRQKRRKKQGRRVHRSRIPDRVSIRERPEMVNARKEFGHWEGDTVEGRAHRDGLHTEVERMSRFLLAAKVSRIASPETASIQAGLFQTLPPEARQSTTLDNGRENHAHLQLHALGMRTYFCDPYASWQRGTNEFHNGLLRRYFPKGTDFATVDEEELQDIVAEINHRPRKCLAFKTPAEVFSSQLGVAIQSRM